MPEPTSQLTQLRYWRVDEPRPSARDLLVVVFRHIRLIRWAFGASLLFAVAYVSNLPDIYEAQAEFLVNRERVEPAVSPDTTSVSQRMSAVTLEEMNSEIQLLRSRDLLRQLASQEHSESVEGTRSLISTFIAEVQLYLAGESTQEQTLERRIRQLERQLEVSRIRDSNTIRARYTSEDPKRAASLLEGLCAAYLKKHVEVRRPRGAHGFFQQQTKRYEAQLETDRGALEAFNRRFGIVSADAERQTAFNQIAEFDSELQRTLIDLRAAEDQSLDLERQLNLTASRVTTQIRTSPRLSENEQATLLTLERKRTELLQKFQPTYPLVLEVEEQIAQSKAAIRRLEESPSREESTDANPTHQRLEGQLVDAHSQIASLKAKTERLREAITESREKLTRVDRLAVQQGDLIRNARIEEENYTKALRREEEARLSDALDHEKILNVAVSEYPIIPELPIGPNRWLLGMVGLFTSLVFSFGLAFIRDNLTSTLRTPEEIERYLGIPVIASVPKL